MRFHQRALVCGFVAVIALGEGLAGNSRHDSKLPPRQDTTYSFHTVKYPGSAFTQALGLNSGGEIAGEYGLSLSDAQGFLLTPEGFITIDFPGAVGTAADGINDTGAIVGGFTGADHLSHGFLYENGNYTQIDVPGATETTTVGINNAGNIVGHFYETLYSARHGFVKKGEVFTTLNFPQASQTSALGINSSGQISGWYIDQSRHSHGFLFTSGVYQSIDVPGADYTIAYG
jgi:probable HAF family extracellular repeat protein